MIACHEKKFVRNKLEFQEDKYLNLDELRNDIIIKQKKGLSFITIFMAV